MAAKASLADLLAELSSLSAGERRLIVDGLGEHDRERVVRLLGKATVTPPPSFDALASLSPWLAESLAAARATVPLPKTANLTAATRDALLDAERLLPTEAARANSSPSLLQRLLARERSA